jgi:preprotein translocase subunit YajC
MDAFRGYQTGSAAAQYALAAQAGQTMQQPALYAAQLQAAAQQQQAAQYAAAVAQQQQQQQQQQNLINSIPAGYSLVRTSNGGYALLAQSQAATAAAMQPQVQQQYISFNAAGQPTATRLPAGMVGGQSQQVIYQYAGQPTIQASPTQYIQLPANYVQQQGLSTSPVMQTASSSAPQG